MDCGDVFRLGFRPNKRPLHAFEKQIRRVFVGQDVLEPLLEQGNVNAHADERMPTTNPVSDKQVTIA